MTKNLISGPILVCLDQIWALKLFSIGFTSSMMLDTVASYHRMQIQGKLGIQT